MYIMASLRVCMFFLIFHVSFVIELTHSHSSICLPENHVALFVFGDSLFDAGNNNYINTTTSVQANFPPYGESFFKYPTGRFSDGRLIPDFIAEHAKLPLAPPYLHPGILHHQYIYGVNFASAGAGALAETRQGLVIDLKTQASYFSQVSKLLRKEVGDAEGKALLSRAVYIFSIGGNDYAVPFLTNSSVVLPYPQQQFVDIVIGNITTVIKEIYKEGGRKFGFVNIYPVNCLPMLRMLRNGSSISECLVKETSALARLHNNALSKMLQNLQKQLKGFEYSVTDLFSALTQVLKNPSKYGFKERNVACCGGGAYRGDNSCGGKRGKQEYELCENVSEFVFFDSLHVTERAYEHFAQLMWSGNGDAIEDHNLKALFQV